MKLMSRLLATFIIITAFCTAGFSQQNVNIMLAAEYYEKGELEKSRELYEDLAKNYKNIPQIHNNYFNVLLDLKMYDEAEDYLQKIQKRFPGNIYYVLDMGLIYRNQGELETMDKYYSRLIRSDLKNDNYKTRIAAQYFLRTQLVEYAIKMYEEGRKASGNPFEYSLELANVYRLANKKEPMIEEYLNYVYINPGNLPYIRNSLQTILSEPEDLEMLENILYQKIQQFPNTDIYPELLIWVQLQEKNFYGAFVQARALDKRTGTEGDKALNIGIISLENKDYSSAERIFNYVIEEYPQSFNYILSKHYLIKVKEEKIKTSYPIDTIQIRELVKDYNQFIEDIGFERTTLEAYRNKAQLHAFYLDEKEEAIEILNAIVENPKSDKILIAKSKLDLGDIYILTEMPWESTLLYSQVEKSMKETPIGYDAKLRNAKLSYYKGEFRLAQEHLDILKEATTREISNDAMQLSLLIKDNTGLDSTEEALQNYAAIELLLFQNKVEDAKLKIEASLVEYDSHPIKDELMWLQADILLKEGRPLQAIPILESIVNDYTYDIWSDDAYYKMGEIYEFQLADIEKAMEIYKDFLLKFPGSIYTAEARKRYRFLRGDAVVNPPTQ